MPALPKPFVSAWEGVPEAFPGGGRSPCQPCGRLDSNPGPHWRQLAESVHPGRQSHANCGLQAVYQIVEAAYEAPVGMDEDEFLHEGIAYCGAANVDDSLGATSAADRQCMLARHGIASELQPQTLDNLEE